MHASMHACICPAGIYIYINTHACMHAFMLFLCTLTSPMFLKTIKR